MKFLFLVEDYFGPAFFEKFFSKKIDEHIFSGKLEGVRHAKLNGKIIKQIRANIGKVDRIIITADADGQDLATKNQDIIRFVDNEYTKYVKIVLLDYEIEEWICHSSVLHNSSTLRTKRRYRLTVADSEKIFQICGCRICPRSAHDLGSLDYSV